MMSKVELDQLIRSARSDASARLCDPDKAVAELVHMLIQNESEKAKSKTEEPAYQGRTCGGGGGGCGTTRPVSYTYSSGCGSTIASCG